MKIVPLDRQRLKEHGVTLAKAEGRWLLRCDHCGESWHVPPMLIPTDYWHCPTWQCNFPGVKPNPPQADDWQDWPPWEEPEPEPDPLDKVIEQELELYLLMRDAADDAKDDEARRRLTAQAERHYARYLMQLETRNALEVEENER